MLTDCFTTKGSSHTICEDYTTKNDVSVVVCDGCSSSPDTDFGARILAKMALGQISTLGQIKPYELAKAVEATILTIPNLSTRAADATLLTAKITDTFVTCEVFGDGIIVRRKGDHITIYEIDCESGAPGYLSYFANDNRCAGYEQKFAGKKRIIRISTFQVEELKVLAEKFQTHLVKHPEGKFEVQEPARTLEAGSLGLWGISFENPDSILLCSDGLSTFEAKFNGLCIPVPVPVVLHYLLKVKKVSPLYMARRAKRFLTKEVSWRPKDDFSIASIWRKAVK